MQGKKLQLFLCKILLPIASAATVSWLLIPDAKRKQAKWSVSCWMSPGADTHHCLFWEKQKLRWCVDHSMWLQLQVCGKKKTSSNNLRNELLAWWFDLWLLQLRMQDSLWQLELPVWLLRCANNQPTLKCSSRSLSFVFEDEKIEWNADLHCAVFIFKLSSHFSRNSHLLFSLYTVLKLQMPFEDHLHLIFFSESLISRSLGRSAKFVRLPCFQENLWNFTATFEYSPFNISE